MRKQLLVLALYATSCITASALQITEIFSNPTGDDSGREWVELYNETEASVDLSSLSLSIKGGTPVAAQSVSGGVALLPGAYAIVGSTVSGATKFGLDYPAFSGPLLKANISLVNTGVTSIDVRLNGAAVDSVSSYTAAKEGYSYAKIGNDFSVISPTPGKENGTIGVSSVTQDQGSTSTQVVGTQTTIPQMSPPSADIIIYLPQERMVVAGAPNIFSVSALTQAGKQIPNVSFTWSFGDGGQGTGSTTVYRYFHPGRYIAFVDAGNGLVAGKARMLIKVVPPEIYLSKVKNSKYGQYIQITNPNPYELDLSTWKLSIDGAMFSLPLNTVVLPGTTTISGAALGFASTTVSTSSIIKLLFSSNEEVVRVTQEVIEETIRAKEQVGVQTTAVTPLQVVRSKEGSKKNNTSSSSVHALDISTTTNIAKKDTRVAEFLRSWFK